ETIEKACQRSTLGNGMKLALVPKRTRGGAVELAIMIHFGSERDLAGRRPAAGAVPDLLMRGTKAHTYEQLKDEMDRLKCKIQFNGAGLGAAMMSVSTVRETLPQVLDLVTEILTQPSFPADQFEVMRKEKLSDLEQMLQDPMSQGFSTMSRMANPYPK